jgi:hypothetical protein
MQKEKLPEYEVPQLTTLTDEEILDQLGEAHAYGQPNGDPPP